MIYCEDCIFYERIENKCKRFPKEVKKSRKDWCGEGR